MGIRITVWILSFNMRLPTLCGRNFSSPFQIYKDEPLSDSLTRPDRPLQYQSLKLKAAIMSSISSKGLSLGIR